MIDGQRLLPDTLDGLSQTLDDWQAAHPGMGLLVLLPEAGKGNVPELQSACRQRGIPLFGAIFPMLITPSGFSPRGAWLVRFDNAPQGFLLPSRETAADTAQEVVQEVEARLAGEVTAPAAIPTLFLIFDGQLPAIGSILTGIYRKLHRRVCYAGVNAGSETFQPIPCLFDAERTLGDGVLGLLFEDAVKNVVEHDYPVSQTLMRATSASGNRVVSIDGRPAFEVYQEISQREFGAHLTKENFYDHAVHYPLGVVTAADVLVRIPVAYDDDGSVHCVGEVPPNSMLRLLRAPLVDDCNCTLKIADQMAEDGGGVLVFYCAGRRMHFKDKADLELTDLAKRLDTPALAGALSLGEIDTMPEVGIPRFHNAAVVCLQCPPTGACQP